MSKCERDNNCNIHIYALDYAILTFHLQYKENTIRCSIITESDSPIIGGVYAPIGNLMWGREMHSNFCLRYSPRPFWPRRRMSSKRRSNLESDQAVVCETVGGSALLFKGVHNTLRNCEGVSAVRKIVPFCYVRDPLYFAVLPSPRLYSSQGEHSTPVP